MRRGSTGALLPPLPQARLRSGDLYRVLRDAILDGSFRGGDRLPSTRAVAAEYGVSRTTVEVAYDQLASEGMIVRTVGRGSFAADISGASRSGKRTVASSIAVSKRGERLARDERCREPVDLVPFNAGVPDATLFPLDLWERCRRSALRETGPGGLNHCDASGYLPLRAQLSRYLAQFRGVVAAPEEIIIFASTAQALTALCLLLADPGEAMLLENPGYPGAAAAARFAGLRIVPVSVDENGIDVSKGKEKRARLAFVTPAHQYPTGVRMSQDRRRQLLDWAERVDAFIIEDDYDADFRYHGEPLTTIRAVDDGRRVVYTGTMSKAMFLGLRLSYAVAPKSLALLLGNLRAQLDGFPPMVTQATLAKFIEAGHLAMHMRVMRRVYADKQAKLLSALQPMIRGGWRAGPTAAGLHFVLYEPRPGEAKRIAEESGLSLNTLSHYANGGVLTRDGLSIRFGGLAEADLLYGARRLCAAARK